jgi:hypothetical protein
MQGMVSAILTSTPIDISVICPIRARGYLGADQGQDFGIQAQGLWVGGLVPLGYDTKERKITVNEAEAERVRTIFRSYLELGSLNLLIAHLRKQGIVSKSRTLRSGKTVGTIPFTRGPLGHLLRNRFYIGEVAFKGEILKGEQPAVLDRCSRRSRPSWMSRRIIIRLPATNQRRRNSGAPGELYFLHLFSVYKA